MALPRFDCIAPCLVPSGSQAHDRSCFLRGVFTGEKGSASVHSCDRDHTSSVINKTYDLWVSQSFADRPFQPFHDCATFTKTQMCLPQCGDCGPLSEVQLGPNSIWKGEVPCGGLNLVFTGTSRNGPATAVIGASVVGNTEATNFAAEGIRDQSCSLGFATTNGKHLYSKP